MTGNPLLFCQSALHVTRAVCEVARGAPPGCQVGMGGLMRTRVCRGRVWLQEDGWGGGGKKNRLGSPTRLVAHQPHVPVGQCRHTGGTSRPGIQAAPRKGISRGTSRKSSRGWRWLSHAVMQMTCKSRWPHYQLGAPTHRPGPELTTVRVR